MGHGMVKFFCFIRTKLLFLVFYQKLCSLIFENILLRNVCMLFGISKYYISTSVLQILYSGTFDSNEKRSNIFNIPTINSLDNKMQYNSNLNDHILFKNTFGNLPQENVQIFVRSSPGFSARVHSS